MGSSGEGSRRQIHDQLETCRLFDWPVSWFGAVEHLVDINRRSMGARAHTWEALARAKSSSRQWQPEFPRIQERVFTFDEALVLQITAFWVRANPG